MILVYAMFSHTVSFRCVLVLVSTLIDVWINVKGEGQNNKERIYLLQLQLSCLKLILIGLIASEHLLLHMYTITLLKVADVL